MTLSWIALRKKVCGLAVLFLFAIFAVSSHAEERAVKSRVLPVYPELAKRMKVGGAVEVQATVNADGNVTEAKATSGNHLLTGAAEDAVHRWRFVSGDGTTVVHVTINFAAPQ